MSVAKEFTTDRNTDVKTAGNRVIEGCNSLLVAYTRDSFKVRAGLPTENKNAVSLAGVEIIVLEGGVIRVPAAHGRGNAPSPCRFYPSGNGAVKRTFDAGIYETGVEAAGVCRCRQKAD